eukprot:gene1478-2840_t
MALNQELLQVKRLSEFAVLPVRGSEFSAGFDLSSAYDAIVPAHGKELIKTDLSIAIPENTYARIAPRSGLAWKNFIDTGAGVVDYDYRGSVGVILFNHGDNAFEIKKGDRVAQLILERISMAKVVEVDELSVTSRGSGGFGSTGVSDSNIHASDEVSKRPRNNDALKSTIASANHMEELLLFVQDILPMVGPEKKTQLKSLVLAGDLRLLAAMKVYRSDNKEDELKETIDLILSS